MTESETESRPHAECAKCRTTIVWPATLTAADKTAIAKATREDGAVAGADLAQSNFGFSADEAKALTQHITRVKGECHRCKRATTEPVSSCDLCESANIDW